MRPIMDILGINVTEIDVGDQLVRADPQDEDIIELAADIQRHGLLQPIGVAKKKNGRYQLLWGSRRLAAHIRLKRDTILSRIYDQGNDSTKTLAIIENIQRKQLTIEEECDAVAHLHHRENLSPDQIAVSLSKSRSWVMRRLEIPHLPNELREAVYREALPLGTAEQIARLDDPQSRAYVLNQTATSSLTTGQVRDLVDAIMASPGNQEAINNAVETALDPERQIQIYLACAACGEKRTPTDLTIVRICKDGCKPIFKDTPEQPHLPNMEIDHGTH